MQRLSIRAAVLVGVAFAALPALAQNPMPSEKLKPIVSRDDTADVPSLVPGDDVTIACDAIQRVSDPSDVRVVLTIAAAPGDDSPGYKKILALNEDVTGRSVRLKVPNAPDLANHTVNLNVYVVDPKKNGDCDAGKYRIVQTPLTTAVAPKNPG